MTPVLHNIVMFIHVAVVFRKTMSIDNASSMSLTIGEIRYKGERKSGQLSLSTCTIPAFISVDFQINTQLIFRNPITHLHCCHSFFPHKQEQKPRCRNPSSCRRLPWLCFLQFPTNKNETLRCENPRSMTMLCVLQFMFAKETLTFDLCFFFI